MKNRPIKNIDEVQRDIDYIIKISGIVHTAGNSHIKHEETHIDVDVVLAEPLSVINKRQSKIERDLREIRQTVINKEQEIMAMVPCMPRREKLIVHEHIHEKRKKPLVRGLTSLFRSYSM